MPPSCYSYCFHSEYAYTTYIRQRRRSVFKHSCAVTIHNFFFLFWWSFVPRENPDERGWSRNENEEGGKLGVRVRVDMKMVTARVEWRPRGKNVFFSASGLPSVSWFFFFFAPCTFSHLLSLIPYTPPTHFASRCSQSHCVFLRCSFSCVDFSPTTSHLTNFLRTCTKKNISLPSLLRHALRSDSWCQRKNCKHFSVGGRRRGASGLCESRPEPLTSRARRVCQNILIAFSLRRSG